MAGARAGLAAIAVALAAVGCSEAARPAAAPTATTGPTAPPTSSASHAPTAPPSPPPGCRADPKAGVHDPWRLLVIERCVTITGVVRAVFVTADGDRHVDVAVDPRFRRTPNQQNGLQNHGWLVTETVPIDQAHVRRPRIGEHVAVTGPLVIDLVHGWAEIHPVWRISSI